MVRRVSAMLLLVCLAAMAAASPVAVPEASPVAVASPVAAPVPVADPLPAANPEPLPVANPEPLPAAAAVPAVPVEAVKQEVEEVAKVQEVAEAIKPQARSLDDEIYNNNDVAKAGGRVPVADTTSGEDALLRKLNTRCAQKDASSCVLLKMVTYFNRLLKKSSIAIGETVEIERTSAVTVSEESSRSLEGESDEDKLTSLMTDKLFNFVRSRSMRLKLLPGADLLVTPNADKAGALNLGMSLQATKDEGRGNKAQKALIPALIAAGAVKLGMLGILAMKGLVLLVGKALILSKIAFLLAVVIGLKKLFSQQKHVTYEVVAQPHHGHSSGGHHESGGHGDTYSSGWGRAARAARALGDLPPAHGEPQELAYRAHH